jgi:hypothetical protein
MRHWHRQFLGRTQLPPTLSALAISEFFTLDPGELKSPDFSAVFRGPIGDCRPISR